MAGSAVVGEHLLTLLDQVWLRRSLGEADDVGGRLCICSGVSKSPKDGISETRVSPSGRGELHEQ